jgi:hypothetical protein
LTLGKVGFAECPGVALGKEVVSSLCREPLDDTRQRRPLCRVPPIWHSANHILKIKKKSLSSAASRALGKEHKLSQSDGFSFFSLTHAHSLHAADARARSPPTPRPRPPSPPATRRPWPCARSPARCPRARAARARRAPARRPRPPTTPRRRPPRRRPPTTSTPSRPFAVVHRPRRANRYKLIFTF